MRIRSGLETYFWLGSQQQQRLGLFSLLLLTLSTIKSLLGFNRMTNCEFLIKVLFIFVVSIVKKKKRKNWISPAIIVPFPVQGSREKIPQSTKVHLSDINQLWLNFSIADLFLPFRINFGFRFWQLLFPAFALRCKYSSSPENMSLSS